MLINDFYDFNYLEINILQKKEKELENQINESSNIIDINWKKEDFNKTLLKFINEKRYRPFEKKLIITKHNEFYLVHNINDNKFYVNKTNYVSHNTNDNYIFIKYTKQNLPQISFPSTRNINDKYYVNKITFKITNRIYINFELKKKITEDGNEKIFRRIYINFNNDKNDKIDNDNINNLLNKCINYF
jgi:hypothetical protein|tara:strand:+ start:3345 stop:3908 length:564 start_codon:yes stop_codon:yes gene_type:complete